MKKITVLIACVLSIFSFNVFAQDDPDPIGYKLRHSRDVEIRVYQETSGHPDFSKFNLWNFNYYFVVVDNNIDYEGKKYVKINIESGNRIMKKKNWNTDGEVIDSDDFNSYLYILKERFDSFKTDGFPRFSKRFLASILTVPLKIRPAIGNHASSMYNANFNAGTFVGVRLANENKGGVSIGLMFGPTTLDQNSSTNDAIKDASSQTMGALNYGGAIVIDVAKKFQMGIVGGFDHGFGDLSKTYIYQNRMWFGLSLNFQFLSFSKKENEQK